MVTLSESDAPSSSVTVSVNVYDLVTRSIGAVKCGVEVSLSVRATGPVHSHSTMLPSGSLLSVPSKSTRSPPSASSFDPASASGGTLGITVIVTSSEPVASSLSVTVSVNVYDLVAPVVGAVK